MAKRERQDDIATAVICWKNIFAKRAFKKWRKAFSWRAGGGGSGGGDDAAADDGENAEADEEDELSGATRSLGGGLPPGLAPPNALRVRSQWVSPSVTQGGEDGDEGGGESKASASSSSSSSSSSKAKAKGRSKSKKEKASKVGGRGSSTAARKKAGEGKSAGMACSNFTGRVGLRNQGNTCYMNSTAQALSHVPILARRFEKDDSLVAAALARAGLGGGGGGDEEEEEEGGAGKGKKKAAGKGKGKGKGSGKGKAKAKDETPAAMGPMPLSAALAKNFRVQWEGKTAVTTPQDLLQVIWMLFSQFKGFRQQDPDEVRCDDERRERKGREGKGREQNRTEINN